MRAFPALLVSVAVAGCVRSYAPIGAVESSGAAPTVQVRDISFAPTVNVVAWSPDESAVGLRAWLRRDGVLLRDHRLYVSTYAVARNHFVRAKLQDQPLRLVGVMRDRDACYGRAENCSPPETFGAYVSDAVLRANRDSLPVTFESLTGNELRITLQRELIDAYLASVDSTSAALRNKWQVATVRGEIVRGSVSQR